MIGQMLTSLTSLGKTVVNETGKLAVTGITATECLTKCGFNTINETIDSIKENHESPLIKQIQSLQTKQTIHWKLGEDFSQLEKLLDKESDKIILIADVPDDQITDARKLFMDKYPNLELYFK